eukprot:CAMPEP_0179343392 /NCGR_PEP_ID=MMETSP0797-20121207/70941_1 /TAXON_ID=47934 /ORGANISM="Dinophysis acuminata, Strain DAEP01" /LENGTH=46 /DNA_ID= /DNA_START= /DNA_END= /DNA_ORIENTATION=
MAREAGLCCTGHLSQARADERRVWGALARCASKAGPAAGATSWRPQ